MVVTDFYEGDMNIKEEEIEEKVEKDLKEKFIKILGKEGILKISPIIRTK